MNLKEKITKALEQGRIEGAKKLASNLLQQENKQAWDKARRDEYLALFPEYREMTADEKTVNDTAEDGTVIEREVDYVYPEVQIEYISIDELGEETRTPSNYVTYSEWMDETEVVTPAVEEVSHIEEIDGIETVVIDTPAVAEVRELVRPYNAPAVDDTMVEAKLNSFSEYNVFKQKEYKKQIETLMAGYPQYERDTFDCQEREAKEWSLDNTVPTPMIDSIALSRNIDKDILVDKILAKSDLFKTAVGAVIGAKQKVLG